ncbi:MAG TPA: hypothetical protein VJJ02_01945 [Candidatus Paceibacterota bacterium]
MKSFESNPQQATREQLDNIVEQLKSIKIDEKIAKRIVRGLVKEPDIRSMAIGEELKVADEAILFVLRRTENGFEVDEGAFD